MHREDYVYGFTSFEDFDAQTSARRYSRMKFGHDQSAREIGYEMAQSVWSRFHDVLTTRDVVVIPSPYVKVKNAATVVTRHMIDLLNARLADWVGARQVAYSTIPITISNYADYGRLTKEERDARNEADRLYLNVAHLRGKFLLFTDDVKITGGHEDKIKRAMALEGMDNDCLFAYYAKYVGDYPQIEGQLNSAQVKTYQDYFELKKQSNLHLLVRPMKFLMGHGLDDFYRIIDLLTLREIRELYFACISEGYHFLPEYRDNLNALKEWVRV